MKKTIALIVLFAVLISVSSPAFAATRGMASLKSIKYSRSGSQDKITLYTSNYKGYKVLWLKNPDRLVVDIPNNKLAISGKQTIRVSSKLVKSIRFSQLTRTTTRVVFDTNGKIPYRVNTAAGALTFLLGKASSTTKTGTSSPSQPSRGDTDRPASVTQRLVFSSSDTYDKIIIPGSGYDGYKIFRLTDPDRIAIDVPNLALPQDQQFINTNGKFAAAVRTSPYDASTTRIVFDTKGQPQYRVEKSTGQLAVILEAPSLRNTTYHNAGDRIYLSLSNTKLTEYITSQTTEGTSDATVEEAGSLKQLYTGSYDGTEIRYTMTFPGNLADTGFGTLLINDGVMSSVDISNNAASGTTSITFNAKSRFVYETITNPETNTTEISILKPYEAKDRLVVIDAGHGGYDPGAQYAGLDEKDLNLKIALGVDEILKSKNILTYMTRDDDTFVPLQTRADIANNLNASLFLSVHNNAYNTSEYGTETLYYPGSSGSGYARVVQDTLVNALGTNDRGIIERPNLVVLNATKMPAVIAEVAFLTNRDDRGKLTDDAFIQKAAEALADSVVKALD